jgi:hypothetical protein
MWANGSEQYVGGQAPKPGKKAGKREGKKRALPPVSSDEGGDLGSGLSDEESQSVCRMLSVHLYVVGCKLIQSFM